ncbi:rhodanese-like domain-containing protein [bacterium]|nr:rhodanese-like domain-containing protein [bacterium]
MKKTLLILLLTVAVLASSCSTGEELKSEGDSQGVIMINAQDAKIRLDNEEAIILLDVRTPEEFYDIHIPGAILLPLDEIATNAENIIPDKEAKYFIYCRSGNRSATAGRQLIDMGYQKVYDLGGIKDWPYEKESGNE